MNSILVPTDFSKNSNAAIDYGCELAKSLGAQILIVNIYTPAVTQHDMAGSLVQEEILSAQKASEENLAAINDQIKKQYPAISCETQFAVGGIVDAIDIIVSGNDIDLVIMGTRGASGLDRILFGSNTTQVIEKVKCPVLAVPVNSPFQRPQRIVYATDFNNEELSHVKKLILIAKAFNAEVMMTHITTDKSALESENLLKRNFAKRVSELTGYDSINYFVKYEDDIRRALDSFTELVNVDWIAMFTRDRTKLFEKLYNPSLTKSMAYQTKIPLLAIKN